MCKCGSQRRKLEETKYKVAVFDSELSNVLSMNFRLSHFQNKAFTLDQKCRKLFEQRRSETSIRDQIAKDLVKKEKEAADLKNCLEAINEHHISAYTGKPIDSLGKSYKTEKLQKFRSDARQALWFAESFGLTPSVLKLRSDKGNTVTVKLDADDDNQLSSGGESKYDKLSLCDKQNLKELVYILDRFAVSDQAYHELVMKTDDLPNKNLIRQCREEMNSEVDIQRTPGNVNGAYVSIRSEITNTINRMEELQNENKIAVKFSGDGTKVGRVKNFINLSISFPQSKVPLTQRTIAIINCSESYESLKVACAPVFDELNSLVSDGKIKIDDKEYSLEFYFGSDMKFINLVLGLGGSTGDFACPWCKVKKDERGNTEQPVNFYHTSEMFRTLSEIEMNAISTKKLYGVKHAPLLRIEPSHIIPDELHLLMRIFDVLLRNLIDDAKDKDDLAKVRKEQANYLDTLVEKIRSCGVTFNVWQPKYGNGNIDWSSLTGDDVKKVMRNLPDKLVFVIHNDTLDETIKIWRDFYELYTFICSPECEGKQIEYIFEKCKSWVDSFLNLSNKRKGYKECNVTPYMHCLLYHVPHFITCFGSLRKYSCQTVEKTNNEVKIIYQQKTNRSDCAIDSLKVKKRIEFCGDESLNRERRTYTKHNSDYWDHEIRESRGNKRQRILSEIKERNDIYHKSNENEIDVNKLSDSEIKAKLSDFGIKTKIRKREKLIDMLQNAIMSNK